MAIKDIGSWLLANPGFVSQFEAMAAQGVARELGPDFKQSSELVNGRYDLSYLLTCASVLAQSNEAVCQAAALRIAQNCLVTSQLPNQRDSAGIVLDTLANHPAMALAIRRELMQPDLQSRLSLPGRIEWSRRKFDDSVHTFGAFLRVNRFQKDFWRVVNDYEWVSVSAPTSAGKSFIVSQWLAEKLAALGSAVAVYIVPTRALISQVERDLNAMFTGLGLSDFRIISAPIPDYLSTHGRNVLVFTQERLNILLNAIPALRVDFLFVDEAHKIGDRARGILLQRVVEDLARTSQNLRVVFASPMSRNPETLVSDAPGEKRRGALTSDYITVSQNLIWVTQTPRNPRIWKAELFLQDRGIQLGSFELLASPVPVSKRLPFVAASIGKNAKGNVIYVDGAAAAEKAATQLYDILEDTTLTPSLKNLIDSCAELVHPQFLLQKVLRRGIAFHYGNLPLLLREEVEALFQRGEIRFLVCTSTLVEGVNTSCRNIFVRGPKRGNNQPMSKEDFWNLAGRAGRWGKEFEGNIICVDANDPVVWGVQGPPRTREKYVIRRATDLTVERLDEFVAYVESGAPAQPRNAPNRFESTFSYLCDLQVAYGEIGAGPWAQRLPAASIARLESVIAAAREQIQVPAALIHRNPGISPFAMDLLLDNLRRPRTNVEDLLPANPGSSDAVPNYASVVGRCATTIAPSIGPIGARHYSVALLITQWMRGHQLSRLIIERIRYFERKGETVNIPGTIRSVMEDVEQVARFEAPRFLSCYRDILRLVLAEKGRSDLSLAYPDLSLLLEYGVSQGTQLSLITSGLSRASTIAISELIGSDTLSKSEVAQWFQINAALWRESSLSPLVKREIEQVFVLSAS